MAFERLRQTALPQALADVVADVADLVQKELRLARAELASNVASKLHASVWMALGIAFGLIAVMLLVQALVFGIASYGIAIHWSCLIVSGSLLVVAALLFIKGRADAQGDLLPTHAINEISRDISLAKEQLT
jgi:uncharacterized membrane protein YqjE